MRVLQSVDRLFRNIRLGAWVGYRILRRYRYTLAGKNPLVRRASAPRIRAEWRAVRNLISGEPPARVQEDSEGRALWRTMLGDFWTPKQAESYYVKQISAEIAAGIYPTDFGSNHPVVFDCGANIGVFGRYAVSKGAALVVAFEPSPENALCLKRNLSKEIEAKRVIVIEKGIWDSETTLRFSTKNTENPGSHSISAEGDLSVPVISIDSAVKELGIDRVAYIKMDIEGAECRAIKGAQHTIASMQPDLCVATEHTADYYKNAVAVIELIKAIDPNYRYVCTEAHGYDSPSRGRVLTPYSIFFRREPR